MSTVNAKIIIIRVDLNETDLRNWRKCLSPFRPRRWRGRWCTCRTFLFRVSWTWTRSRSPSCPGRSRFEEPRDRFCPKFWQKPLICEHPLSNEFFGFWLKIIKTDFLSIKCRQITITKTVFRNKFWDPWTMRKAF